MTKPYDPVEEQERLSGYSKVLRDLPYSEFYHRCDPADESGYPALILQWQYAEGLLVRRTSADKTNTTRLLSSKDPRSITERRCEWARKLVCFLVAKQARKSPE